jgi:aminopeptidase N
MSEGTAMLIRREEYTAPAFWIKTVDLTFDLEPGKTLVINKMTLERNPGHARRAPASGW